MESEPCSGAPLLRVTPPLCLILLLRKRFYC
jgi:hypothetical protein